MSFIISRGYADIQNLKTSESDPLSFWNVLIYICSNFEKKVKVRRTLYIFICKKKKCRFFHIFVCNICSAVLHFRM